MPQWRPHAGVWPLTALLLLCATDSLALPNCTQGQYASGASTCASCAPGTYLNATGSHSETQCRACEPGRYSPLAGMGQCWTCPKGSTSPRAGATSCVLTLACNPCTDRTAKKVRAVLHGTDSDGHFLRIERAMELAAWQLKVDFKCYLQPRVSSVAYAAKIAEVVAQESPDVLLVSIPYHASDALVPVVRAAAQKAHVFTVSEGVEHFRESGGKAHFGADEEGSGRDAAAAFQRAFAPAGKNLSACATVSQGPLQGASLLRRRGFLRACGALGLAWLGDLTPTDGAAASSETAALLRSYRDSGPASHQGLGLLVLNSGVLEGARRAISFGYGVSVKLGVYGNGEEALAGLGGGELAFAVRENEWLQGYLSVVLSVIYLTTGNLMAHPVYRTEEFVTSAPSSQELAVASEGYPVCSCPWAGGLESLVSCSPDSTPSVGVCPVAGGSCSASCKDGRKMKVVGVTHAHEADTFWFLVKAGAEQAARDLRLEGFEMDLFGPPSSSRSDAFTQELFVKTLRETAQRPEVDAMLVSIHGSYVYSAITEAAQSKALVTINSGYDVAASLNPPGGKWLAHVGMDEFAAGKLAGEVLANAGVKHLLCLPHDQTESGALKERLDGARESAQARGLRVTVFNMATEANIALDNDDDISAVIQSKLADASIDGVLIFGSPMVGAAADAFPRVRTPGQLVVGTFDRPQKAIEMMDAGQFFIFGIDQQQYMQGYVAVIVAWVKKFTGTKLNFDVIQTGPFMVTGSELLKDACKALPWTTSSVDRPGEAVVGDRLLPSVDVRQTEGFPVCLYSGDCSIEGLYFNLSQGGCRPCPAGTFKNRSMLSCKACPPGTSTEGGAGSRACTACSPGRVAAGAAAECAFCPRGAYAGRGGMSVCDRCPFGLTTPAIATVAREDCVCPAGRYMRDGVCYDCLEGMACRTGSSTENYRFVGKVRDAAALHPYPELLPGFWSSSGAPLHVFRCMNDHFCPGGDPGLCAHGLQGRSCQHCADGFTWTGETCKECPASRAASFALFPGLLWFCMVPIIVVMYAISGDPVERWGSRRNSISTIGFIALVHYQKISLLKTSDLPQTQEIDIAIGSWTWTTDVSEIFGTKACSGYNTLFMTLLDKVTTPVVFLFCTICCFFVSEAVASLVRRSHLRMDQDRLTNVYMTVIFTFFTSISAASLLLFQCADNPNGEFTLVADRSVLCLTGNEWVNTLFIAIPAVLIYVILCGSMYIWAIVRAPKHFHSEIFRRRWKFLFLKYRPDVHWWSLVFLTNAFINNLTFVLLTDAPSQLLMLISANMIYVALLGIFKPYRLHITNLLDIQATLSVIWVCCGIMWFTDRLPGAALPLAQLIRVVAYGHLAFSLLTTWYLIVRRMASFASMVEQVQERQIQESYSIFLQLGYLQPDEWSDFFCTLDEQDQRDIMKTVCMLKAEFHSSASRRAVSGRHRYVGSELMARVRSNSSRRSTTRASRATRAQLLSSDISKVEA